MKNNNLTIENKGWLSVLAIIMATALTVLEISLNNHLTNNTPWLIIFVFLVYYSFFLLINVDSLFVKINRTGNTDNKDLFFTIVGILHIVIFLWILINLGHIAHKNWLEIFTANPIVNILAYVVIAISTISLFTYYNKIIVPQNKLLFLNNMAYFPGEELNLGPIRYPKNIILLNDVQELEQIQQEVVCQEGYRKVCLDIKIRILIEKVPRYSLEKNINTPLTAIREKLITRLMNCSREASLIQNIEELIPVGEAFNLKGYKFELQERKTTIKATK